MDSSDNSEILPSYSHRHLHRHHQHHQCLELSPHCPQHGGYFLRLNSHHHPHTASASANGHHHHHHHLQLSPDCPLHGHLLPHCPLHSSNIHPNNQCFPITPKFSSIRNPNLNSIPSAADASSKSGAPNEEDEDEFIFVLTDEWKEFFAKSEAKRRLAKKQAKKKGKD